MLSSVPPKIEFGEKCDLNTASLSCISTMVGWMANWSMPTRMSTGPEYRPVGHGVVGLNLFLTEAEMVTAAMVVISSTT